MRYIPESPITDSLRLGRILRRAISLSDKQSTPPGAFEESNILKSYHVRRSIESQAPTPVRRSGYFRQPAGEFVVAQPTRVLRMYLF